MGLLALGAGFALFVIVLYILERSRETRLFWLGRVAIAAVVGIAFDRLAPLWTRFDDVLAQPSILVTADTGTAGLTGALFAFAGVCLASLLQLSRAKGVRRWPLLASVGAGLLLAGGLAVFGPRSLDGRPELHVSVPDLEGRTHTLAEWTGKVTVLNFWATWCPPCVAEMPDLKTFADSKAATLIGVNALATEKVGVAGVVHFAAENKATWPQLADPKGDLQKAYSVAALPTTVVLDRQGVVIARHEGAVEAGWLQSAVAQASP